MNGSTLITSTAAYLVNEKGHSHNEGFLGFLEYLEGLEGIGKDFFVLQNGSP